MNDCFVSAVSQPKSHMTRRFRRDPPPPPEPILINYAIASSFLFVENVGMIKMARRVSSCRAAIIVESPSLPLPQILRLFSNLSTTFLTLQVAFFVDLLLCLL